MKEYIEREAIISALKDYYEPINPDFPMTLKLSQISEVLQTMPVADVAPVRHGRWILVDKNGTGVCSECNRQDHIDLLATHCRYCGALMDGKEDAHE